MAPAKTSIRVEWLGNGDETEIFFRKRGESKFCSAGSTRSKGFDLSDLVPQTDYEFYLRCEDRKSAARPLPQAEGIRFLFGCETEMNRFHTIGISKKCIDEMDFIIVPTTHFHMKDYTLFAEQIATPQTRAAAWAERFAYLLHQDLPFRKMGVAHLLCSLICRDRPVFLETISALSDDTLHSLFRRAAEVGIGIELNSGDCTYADEEAEIVLRPFRVAKEEGCKFYCGSDAHKPAELDKAKARFQRAVDALELEESDKFRI